MSSIPLNLSRARQSLSWVFLFLVTASCIAFVIGNKLSARKSMYAGVVAYYGKRPAFLADAPGIVAMSAQNDNFPGLMSQAETHVEKGQSLTLPFGMFEMADHHVEVVVGEKGLIERAQRLFDQTQLAKRPKAHYLFALVAWILGALLGSPLRQRGALVVGICATFAASLVRFRCQTCPITDTFLGYDTAKCALIVFGVAALAGLSRSKYIQQAYLPLLLATSVVQLGLFWGASSLCQICLTIFCISAFFIGSHAGVREQKPQQQLKLRPQHKAVHRLYQASAPTLALIALCSLAYPSSAAHAAAAKAKSAGHVLFSERPSLAGLDLENLGLTPFDKLKSLSYPRVLVIGSRTCMPCVEARFWASTLPGIDYTFVDEYPSKDMVQAGPQFTVQADFIGSYTAPTLILVGPNKKVLDSWSGWARDPRLESILQKRFVDAVRSTKGQSAVMPIRTK